MKSFYFIHQAPDLMALRAQLADPACGGYVSFEGLVRNNNEGQQVHRLEYEAFEELAVKEGQRIVDEALRRFGVQRAMCVHRLGALDIGGLAVWVGVSAGHRGEAFAACRYIIDEVKHRVPIWKKEHYLSGDSGWVNCERCAVASVPDADAADDHHHRSHAHSAPQRSPTALRFDYSRQMSLPEVGAEGQKRLAAARVLVIGAGGLGVPVLTYLAGAGIGTLGIADADVVDASNLHRQTLYQLADVGAPKAQLATQRLRSLNPEITLRAHSERMTSANIEAVLDGYDIVVDCTDNFSAKFLINDAAVRLKKHAIFASIYQYEGQLQVYRADADGACLRCLWPEATRDGLVGNCAEAGVLGPVPGVLGSLQALEVLKLLLRLPGQLREEILLLDLLTLQQQKIRTTRAADCDHSGTGQLIAQGGEHELNFSDLAQAVKAGYRIVDIREAQEIEEQPLAAENVLNIPTGVLLADPSVLSAAENYLLVCARGARSQSAVDRLRHQGVSNAFSLAGGVRSLCSVQSAITR